MKSPLPGSIQDTGALSKAKPRILNVLPVIRVMIKDMFLPEFAIHLA